MISFIVGTKNRPDELKRFISHLKKQTSQDYEIIVADEGDNMWVIKEGVKYMQGEWQEDWHYSIKNEAVELAEGDYLAFPQDDAVYNPEFVEKMQQGDLCICGWEWQGERPPSKRVCEIDIGGFTVKKDKFTGFESSPIADGKFTETFEGDVKYINDILYEKR